MSIIGSNVIAGASGQAGYNLNNSLRFRASAPAYLSRTPASATNRKTWTWSAWVKRGALGSQNILFFAQAGGNTNIQIGFLSDNTLRVFQQFSGVDNFYLITTQLFRDPSAWYHIVVTVDTTQATSSNRAKMYINGQEITAFSGTLYTTLNLDTTINSTVVHYVGSDNAGANTDGYMTEINFIDGQALTPSSFGETSLTTGSWIPKRYTSTYGTNGFYLKFADASAATAAAIGKDSSGNGNNWTPNNISVTAGVTYDAMLDVPTNTSATVGNYCTINPLRYGITYTPTVSEGNLKVAWAGDTSVIIGTMNIPSSGKWYWEAVVPTQTYNFLALGVVKNQETSNLNGYLGTVTTGYGVYVANGNKLVAAVSSTYMAIPSQNTVVTVAFDADTGTLYIGAGGSWANGSGSTNQAFSSAASIVTGLTGDISPAFSFNTGNAIVNFGQRPFTYTPPTGYKALNTFNLPDSTIKKGDTVMDATLYTGNGANRSITNASAFKPDAIWIKTRSAGAYNHHLVDSVRGANKNLRPNLTGAEDTTTDQVTAINSNGFSLGVDTAGPADSEVNVNGNTYVAWQWQAGQGSTSSNTSGSITSTVSVNATAGFSVVTYTGNGSSSATVGHGLGVAPSMVIIKNRGATANWVVRHSSLTSIQNVSLTSDAAYTVSSGTSNGGVGAFTSTTFGFISGTVGLISSNASAATYVAYCWAEIAGFSKFTSYTGNNSADGPFVYCGFRPKFVMIKDTNTAGAWIILDSNRATYNVAAPFLQPSTSAAEVTIYNQLDFLSNGIKLRANNADSGQNNVNGNTYIVMAFAENPFKNANAR